MAERQQRTRITLGGTVGGKDTVVEWKITFFWNAISIRAVDRT
jgi:hypothetical protein